MSSTGRQKTLYTNAQRVRAVLDVLKQQGVKPEEMQTSDLDALSKAEALGTL
jgi:uncharacterized protein YggE